MNTEASVESEFYMEEFETDNEDNLESKVTRNKSLLPGLKSTKKHVLVFPGPRPAEYHISEDTVSMIKFDMMHFSPLANPTSATID